MEVERRAQASQIGTKHLTDALQRMKESQKEIVEQERTEVLERMVKGITHNFSEALVPIIGGTELLLCAPDVLADREKAEECLKSILKAAEKVRDSAKNLDGFFHHGEVVAEPVDLNHLVEMVVDRTRPRWQDEARGKGIAIRVTTSLKIIPPVGGDGTELETAVTHLVTNAIEALPKGGTIFISSRAKDDSVLLEIRDTGKGMSEETRRHCLEPFFSTKEEPSAGMGLTVVSATVHRHHGNLAIDSRAGSATRVTVTLPVWAPPDEEDDLDSGLPA
jgi:signal transduction histidine kinase